MKKQNKSINKNRELNHFNSENLLAIPEGDVISVEGGDIVFPDKSVISGSYYITGNIIAEGVIFLSGDTFLTATGDISLNDVLPITPSLKVEITSISAEGSIYQTDRTVQISEEINSKCSVLISSRGGIKGERITAHGLVSLYSNDIKVPVISGRLVLENGEIQ